MTITRAILARGLAAARADLAKAGPNPDELDRLAAVDVGVDAIRATLPAGPDGRRPRVGPAEIERWSRAVERRLQATAAATVTP